MASRNPTVTATKYEATTACCPCGEPTCAGTCCDLDCLVQPRFFRGQLLTDTDLTALLNWSQAKQRLTRYRDGWGVVCGLAVRCDPDNPGHVIVEPGYAVNCCGDDIIVCEPISFDLSAACRRPEDPCETFAEETSRGYGRYGSSEAIYVEEISEHEPEQEREIVGVVLSIQYEEKGAMAVAPLSQHNGNGSSICEYSRTQETFKLSWQPAAEFDPIRLRAERWERQYLACADIIRHFMDNWEKWLAGEYPEQQPDVLARDWLLQWLAKYPLHQFCFLHDIICEQLIVEPRRQELGVFKKVVAEQSSHELADYADVLFGIAQDCRNAFLAGSCHHCLDDAGVPLAYIALSEADDQCRVFYTDPYPPYRRPLSPERWPAPAGMINGGQVIWHHVEDACTRLGNLGIHIQKTIEIGNLFPELLDIMYQSPMLPCDAEPIQLLYLDTGMMGKRVVGFVINDDRRSRVSASVREKVSREAKVASDEEDDLREIKGIGQGRMDELYQAGIKSYALLARTPVVDLKKIFKQVSEAELGRWCAEAERLAAAKRSQG